MLAVEDIHEDDDDVGAAHDADDFLATALAHGCTGDKARDIESADSSTFVFEGAGHYGECRKSVCSDRTFCAGEFIEEVLLPVDGKPTRTAVASPDFLTE